MFDKTMVRLFLAVVAFNASLALVNAQGTNVVYSTLGPGDSYSLEGGLAVGDSEPPYYEPACAFSPSTTVTFEEIDLAVGAVGRRSGQNSVDVDLCADDSGMPGSVLESFTFTNLPSFGQQSSGDLLEGDSVLHPELFAGTQYWVTVQPEDVDSWDGWNGSSPAVSGLVMDSINGGSTWTNAPYSPAEAAFRIDGLAVPEPSTFALLIVGAVGLLGWSWRQRRLQMLDKTMVRGLLAVAVVASAVTAQADVFNMGGTISGGTWTGLASLQFVTVGDPGNVADPVVENDGLTGYGSVPYVYQMGKYDVTTAQYCQFLNAVATTADPYGLYDSNMSTYFPTFGIARIGSSGSYSYSVTGSATGKYNMPIPEVSWGDAARFCNWLQNGQPSGPGTVEGPGTTETGSYNLSGATTNAALLAVSRSTTAVYVLPTANEYYKAAYYNPSSGTYWAYPTQSNTAPSNALSSTGTDNANYDTGTYTDPTNYLTPVGYFEDSPGPYGTYDMGGDVLQWDEEIIYGTYRGLRGGSWGGAPEFINSSNTGDSNPTYYAWGTGFRVADVGAVPEPGSLALLLAGAVAFGIWRLRRKA